MANGRLRLRRVSLANIGSIRRANIDLEPEMTMLVGLNGSGKSSVMTGLGLPGRILAEGLEAAMSASIGGFSRLHRLRAREPLSIRFEFVSARGDGHYEVAIGVTKGDDLRLVNESARWLDAEYSRESLGITGPGTILDHAGAGAGGLEVVRNVVSGVQVYWTNLANIIDEHERDTNSRQLDVCSYNWASVAERILKGSRADDVRQALHAFTGDLVDLRVLRSGGLAHPEVFRASTQGVESHRGVRGDWVALAFLSSGTVRLLDLLITFLQDAPLTLVGFEHPEADVHPGMAALIVDYAREAAARRQVVFTTHSPDVLAEVPANAVRVVEKVDGATTVRPLDRQQRQAVEGHLFGLDELFRIDGLRSASA